MMLAYIEGNIISKKLIFNLVLDFNLKATLLIRLINAASFSYKSLIFKESSNEWSVGLYWIYRIFGHTAV